LVRFAFENKRSTLVVLTVGCSSNVALNRIGEDAQQGRLSTTGCDLKEEGKERGEGAEHELTFHMAIQIGMDGFAFDGNECELTGTENSGYSAFREPNIHLVQQDLA
jgi:hypothetical protein